MRPSGVTLRAGADVTEGKRAPHRQTRGARYALSRLFTPDVCLAKPTGAVQKKPRACVRFSRLRDSNTPFCSRRPNALERLLLASESASWPPPRGKPRPREMEGSVGGGRAAPPTGGGVIDQGRCSDVSTHPSPACSLLLCRRDRSGFSSLVKVGYQRWPREIRKCCQSRELAVEVQSNVHIVLHSCDAIEVGLFEMH